MEEEEEICRVCRSEGTTEQPLFHPCKCAGSIRYVHQECLIEWLTHSRKKYCELCEHPFTFTPVYRQDMPVVLPPKLFVQQLRKKLAFAAITTLRAILVSCIWLIILPYFTVWVWRLYFFLGANLSRNVSRLQQMKGHYGISSGIIKNNTITTAASLLLPGNNETDLTTLIWIQDYKSRLTLQTFLSDCFEGQIITCIVVVIFVAVFLLREWIVQNIPMEAPAIEEEEEEEEEEDDPMVMEPPQELQDRFPRILRYREDGPDQFDASLFDVDWDQQPQQQLERPASPVAMNDEIWLNNQSSNSTSSNHDHHIKPTRATSLPPSFSTSSSFHDDADEGFNNNNNDYMFTVDSRRSASMEPFIDTSSNSSTSSSRPNNNNINNNTGIGIVRQQEDVPRSPTLIHRGHPPHAPRMRHAEAPVPIIRPIPEEEEEEERVPPPRVVPHQLHRRQDRPAPAAAVPINNEDEEEEENIEEFEGVLEAIGMQGSLWTLLQNCALMGLLIALSIGVAVALPYLIGMLFILTDALDVIRIPLKLARFVTDPLVDLIFLLCTEYIGPWMTILYQDHIQSLIIRFTSLPILNSVSYAFIYIFNYIMDHGLFLADSSSSILSDPNIPTATMNATTTNTSFIDAVIKFINETEPMIESTLDRYQSFATGQTSMDRFVCISVGYIIVTIVSCWYLARSAQNDMAAAGFGRTAQEALRHQGIIFKVGMFITIELILFPIVCGFLLDLSTMSLFVGANLLSRWIYLKQHPLPSIFLHWFLGTGFMFLFAVLVTLCRDIVRPGVMWFIRDPNDPQFHPIREIVERPIFFQFKKIGASALIYLTVILVGVGGIIHTIHMLPGQILPLRWNLSTPLSVVPVDLIMIQVGIPAIVKYFQPKQNIKALFVASITWICRQLRLSSFIFGGRKPEEEGTLVYHTWPAWLSRTKPLYYPAEGSLEDIIGREVSYFWDGQLMRVPRHDSVPILNRRRMLIPVDAITLEPIDETERRLGHPAASAPGGNEINTIIVYSPPHFKQRLLVFLAFMWLSISFFGCAVTIVPVLLGRALFKEGFSVTNEVHDIYSFVLGGCIMLLVGALANQCYKTMKDISSQTTWLDICVSIWQHTKQWSQWIFRWAFFVISFGVIIPLVLGSLIELYFVLPMRKLDNMAPSVEVMMLWAHGFASMVILHGCIQVAPDNSFRELIAEMFRGGIHEMNIRKCLARIIIPLSVVSAFAILLPFNVVYLNMKLIAPNNPEIRIKLIQIVYPLALSSIGAYILVKLGSRLGTSLVQNIREDNYLVGRTLHNLEQ